MLFRSDSPNPASGDPYPVAGRSLRASMPFARSDADFASPSWLRSSAYAGSRGTGHPKPPRLSPPRSSGRKPGDTGMLGAPVQDGWTGRCKTRSPPASAGGLYKAVLLQWFGSRSLGVGRGHAQRARIIATQKRFPIIPELCASNVRSERACHRRLPMWADIESPDRQGSLAYHRHPKPALGASISRPRDGGAPRCRGRASRR